MGFHNIVEEAMLTDRSGFDVLEFLLRDQNKRTGA
jgi:hypothetical protein